mmetsp:Transcript_53520/g.148400  ORF Transcript_53520/g.148400 Transcript_53520/m.148400 type:complete len:228 (-) Transcript_53520:639-1322(-)
MELAVEMQLCALWEDDIGLGAVLVGMSRVEDGELLLDRSAHISRSSTCDASNAARNSFSSLWPTLCLPTSCSTYGRTSRMPRLWRSAAPSAPRTMSSNVSSNCRSFAGSSGPSAPLAVAWRRSYLRSVCRVCSARWARESRCSSETIVRARLSKASARADWRFSSVLTTSMDCTCAKALLICKEMSLSCEMGSPCWSMIWSTVKQLFSVARSRAVLLKEFCCAVSAP